MIGQVIYSILNINLNIAHLHHIEQFWYEGTLDYSQHMHAHGPCTYPGI